MSQQKNVARYVNHFAFLVNDVIQVSQRLRGLLEEKGLSVEIGPKEIFQSEGTAEIYVGSNGQTSRLLFIEPVGPGPYESAFKKRGSGLHHIALDVLDLETFLFNLKGSGWYLHLHSVQSIKSTRTAWLARPDTPVLIEVQEIEAMSQKKPLINELKISMSDKLESMMNALGVDQVKRNRQQGLSIEIQGQRIQLESILGV
ncbi:MAG: VOC family protein [Proteobacteria bacterium]|nr:VOC family protein [Pseudomonadota bacterium]